MAKVIACEIGDNGAGGMMWSDAEQAWLVDVLYVLDMPVDPPLHRDIAVFRVFREDVVTQNPLALLHRVKQAIIEKAAIRWGVVLAPEDILYIP